jgi:hypothetical protein
VRLTLRSAPATVPLRGADGGGVAPPTERAFFGVGPVVVAVPERLVPGHSLPVISAEDTEASQRLTDYLQALNFAVDRTRVPAGGGWLAPRR